MNIIGFIRGDLGLGEAARRYASALIDAGVDVALYDIDLGLPHGRADHSMEAWITDQIPHRFSVVFVNPDYLQEAIEQVGATRLRETHLVGCWFWELDRVPTAWLPAVGEVDEIMVASRFVEDAFSRATDKPLLRVPIPVSEPMGSDLVRADFGLEDGKFIFLCSFDFDSSIVRKNPIAAVQAFTHAFPPERDDVRLLIKSSNGARYPAELLRLLEATMNDARIMVRDQIIERRHLIALQRCCDAYVSLHRSEGFGLVLAECMALGKPVVATGWSGNMDYMSEDVAELVSCTLRRVGEGEYAHAGGQWAEPSIAEASEAMRRLADDPQAAATLGMRGRQHVLHDLSPQRVVGAIKLRFDKLMCEYDRGVYR